MKRYTVTAGNNNTDMGVVGSSDTLLGAKRIGRKVITDSLPNGHGTYYVHVPGCERAGETRSIRTGNKWVAVS